MANSGITDLGRIQNQSHDRLADCENFVRSKYNCVFIEVNFS
jgi:hypothetical protein